MDKSRDVRRGASRFSRQHKINKQSGHKLVSVTEGLSNGVASLEKLKRERIKKLSAVNRASEEEEGDHEMVRGVSDREEQELPSSSSSSQQSPSVGCKKYNNKLPKKSFEDSNGVDHASVPRKLRSAMKKRNRESTSPHFPDSKKLNKAIGGVESLKRDGVKKSKFNVKQGGPEWSQNQSVCGPITKDEEEVVETLYALAGMFPHYQADNESKLESASLDGTAPALPEASDSPPTLEAINEDSNPNCLSRTDKAANHDSNVKCSTEKNVRIISLKEPNFQEQTELTGSNIPWESDSSVSLVNMQTMLIEHEERKSLGDAAKFTVAAELYHDKGKLMHPAKVETLVLDRKPEISSQMITAVGIKQDPWDMVHESKKNGPALWPGLPSMVSNSTWSHGPSSQSCTGKAPAWLDSTLSASRPGTLQNVPSIGKVSIVNMDRRSWKRCAAHVYISRLICSLQTPGSKDNLLPRPKQVRPQEILKQGVLMTADEFNVIRNGSNGATSINGVAGTTEKNSMEASSSVLKQQWLHQDQPHTALASGVHASQKQSFNFLSLSTGDGGLGVSDSFKGGGNRVEPLVQLQVPYTQTNVQHRTLVPFSMPQAQYSTSSYPDQPSTAAAAQQAKLQQPSYLGSPYCGPNVSSTTLSKQLTHQHQLQQQQLWAAQFAAQYRTAGMSTAVTQYPIWQNGRQDSSLLTPCAQSVVQLPASSREVLAMKYPQISRQQQLITVPSTLPPARGKRQNHHLSSAYEENRGLLRASGALPFQLLCNEYL